MLIVGDLDAGTRNISRVQCSAQSIGTGNIMSTLTSSRGRRHRRFEMYDF